MNNKKVKVPIKIVKDYKVFDRTYQIVVFEEENGWEIYKRKLLVELKNNWDREIIMVNNQLINGFDFYKDNIYPANIDWENIVTLYTDDNNQKPILAKFVNGRFLKTEVKIKINWKKYLVSDIDVEQNEITSFFKQPIYKVGIYMKDKYYLLRINKKKEVMYARKKHAFKEEKYIITKFYPFRDIPGDDIPQSRFIQKIAEWLWFKYTSSWYMEAEVLNYKGKEKDIVYIDNKLNIVEFTAFDNEGQEVVIDPIKYYGKHNGNVVFKAEILRYKNWEKYKYYNDNFRYFYLDKKQKKILPFKIFDKDINEYSSVLNLDYVQIEDVSWMKNGEYLEAWLKSDGHRYTTYLDQNLDILYILTNNDFKWNKYLIWSIADINMLYSQLGWLYCQGEPIQYEATILNKNRDEIHTFLTKNLNICKYIDFEWNEKIIDLEDIVERKIFHFCGKKYIKYWTKDQPNFLEIDDNELYKLTDLYAVDKLNNKKIKLTHIIPISEVRINDGDKRYINEWGKVIDIYVADNTGYAITVTSFITFDKNMSSVKIYLEQDVRRIQYVAYIDDNWDKILLLDKDGYIISYITQKDCMDKMNKKIGDQYIEIEQEILNKIKGY